MKLRSFTTFGALAMFAVCAHGQVKMRGGASLDASVTEATLAGLRVQAKPESDGAKGGGARLVSWDRVKRVDGEKAGVDERFRTIADTLWRARTRVERGDFAAAEPLFDELAQVYGAERGPSAAVVAEGVLRCRLSRGAQGSATAAWLWWSWLIDEKERQASGPEWIGGGTSLPPVVDAATGLAPSLPPVWAPVASTGAAASSVEWSRLRAMGGEVGELAELYEKSARFEAGLDDEITLTSSTTNTPGVSLVRDIVLARGGDSAAREGARASLEGRVRVIAAAIEAARGSASGSAGGGAAGSSTPASPRWVEAWCRLGLGRSLVRETDDTMRMRGVIELLHIPARFSEEQPFLAGIALAEAAVTMAKVGDTRAAGALKGELLSRHPWHPVVQWEELSKIKAGGDATRRAAGM